MYQNCLRSGAKAAGSTAAMALFALVAVGTVAPKSELHEVTPVDVHGSLNKSKGAFTVLYSDGSVPVEVQVELASPATAFPHYWKTTFGSGHARLSVRGDWQAHLKQAVSDRGWGGGRGGHDLPRRLTLVVAPLGCLACGVENRVPP